MVKVAISNKDNHSLRGDSDRFYTPHYKQKNLTQRTPRRVNCVIENAKKQGLITNKKRTYQNSRTFPYFSIWMLLVIPLQLSHWFIFMSLQTFVSSESSSPYIKAGISVIVSYLKKHFELSIDSLSVQQWGFVLKYGIRGYLSFSCYLGAERSTLNPFLLLQMQQYTIIKMKMLKAISTMRLMSPGCSARD